jgi:hypothetical protein
MPGMRAIVRRCGWAEQQDELCSMVVATGCEKIRRYPLERRPNRIASNIVNDTRRALHDRFVDIRVVEVPTADVDLDRFPHDARQTKTAADRVGEIVTQAVKRGVVSNADARLIVETRIFDVSIDRFAEDEGINAQSLRRRRLRAENRIAETTLS